MLIELKEVIKLIEDYRDSAKITETVSIMILTGVIEMIKEKFDKGGVRVSSELTQLLACPLTDDEINIIKDRCLNTTGGEWNADIEEKDASWPDEWALVGGIPLVCGWDGEEGIYGSKEDLEFIGHSKQDILRLIATIYKLKQRAG